MSWCVELWNWFVDWRNIKGSGIFIVWNVAFVRVYRNPLFQNVDAIYKNQGFPYHHKLFSAASKPNDQKQMSCCYVLMSFTGKLLSSSSLCWCFTDGWAQFLLHTQHTVMFKRPSDMGLVHATQKPWLSTLWQLMELRNRTTNPRSDVNRCWLSACKLYFSTMCELFKRRRPDESLVG